MGNVEELKHRVRCLHKVREKDGWRERIDDKTIRIIESSGIIKKIGRPHLLRGYVSEDEFRRYLCSKLYFHHRFDRNSQILGQQIAREHSVALPLPKDIRNGLRRELGINIDKDSSDSLWQNCLQRRYLETKFIVKEILFGGNNRKHNSGDVYLEGAHVDSGPTKSKNESKHRLSLFLYEELCKELGNDEVEISCKEWDEGMYFNKKLRVNNVSFKLPVLSAYHRFCTVLQCLKLCRLFQQKSIMTEGLSIFFMPEFLKALCCTKLNNEDLPKFRFYTLSNAFSRNLEDLILDSKGSRSVMLSYSINTGPYLRKKVPNYLKDSWGLCNIRELWSWGESHNEWAKKHQVRRVKSCSSYPFIDSDIKLPALPRYTIAIFDVQPHRDSHLAKLGLDGDYCTIETALAFINDTSDIIYNLGYRCVYKRKRDVGRNLHVKYRKTIQSILTKEFVIEVDPSIAASRIIEKVDAVISFPFTSTAVQARDLGKPSCFYDPTGGLLNPQAAAYGIEIIQSNEALREWIIKQMPIKNEI